MKKGWFISRIVLVLGLIALFMFSSFETYAAVSGGSFIDAAPVVVDRSYKVENTDGKGGKYFVFKPTVSGTYYFSSSLYVSSDPYIKVYDKDQYQLGSNDDGGSGLNYYLSLSLDKGETYYIYSYGVEDDGYMMEIKYQDWSLDSTASLPAGTTTTYIYAYDAYITSVTSSNPNVVTASISYRDGSDETSIILTKKSSGKATITVTAENGTKKTCAVTCVMSAFAFSKTKIVFGKKLPYSTEYLYPLYRETSISSVRSSKPKVAKVSIDYGAVRIEPLKVGRSVVTATDSIGRTASVTVVVSKNWISANLKIRSYMSVARGNKKMYVSSKPGATAKIRIGGKTYTTKIGKKGYKYIKLKKPAGTNAKITATFKYKNASAKKTGKAYSNTSGYMQTIYSCQYTIPVRVYNIRKGDYIYIIVGGKTYRKKAARTADRDEYVFTTKYQNRNYYSIRIVIRDKKKRKLYDRTTNIRWR